MMFESIAKVAGAPFECLLCQLLGQSLAANILWSSTCVNLFVYLCERLSSPGQNLALDVLKSVMIYIVCMGTLLGGNFVSLVVREAHIAAVVAWSMFAACVFFFTWRRAIKQSQEDIAWKDCSQSQALFWIHTITWS